MDKIFLVKRQIGDLTNIEDKAYWYYEGALNKSVELKKEYDNKGYTDFTFCVEEIELIGLK